MQKVFVVTDSTADLPKNLVDELGITVIPFTTVMDGVVYREGLDISTDEFYEIMANCRELPRTSQPTPNEYIDIFKLVSRANPEAAIFHVAFSSALSGAYQSALIAKDMLPDLNITVFDSKAASIGQGWLALAAARLAREGKGSEEILDALRKIRDKLYTYFTVDTLEYLRKGGRLSAVKTVIGTVMNIKPILLCNEEGKLIAFDKVRGRKQALRKLVDLVGENVKDFSKLHLGIAAGGCREDQETVRTMIEEKYGVKDILLSDIGIVIGTHTGPGVIDVIFYED